MTMLLATPPRSSIRRYSHQAARWVLHFKSVADTTSTTRRHRSPTFTTDTRVYGSTGPTRKGGRYDLSEWHSASASYRTRWLHTRGAIFARDCHRTGVRHGRYDSW